MILGDLFLTEADWFERSPLTPILERNRGRFIHFSNVPKLGVNPKKFHTDPHGVYFYPIDWLLTRPPNAKDGQQFGLEMPYYFIVDIDQRVPGIKTSDFTMDDMLALAERNGWRELWETQKDKAVPKYMLNGSASQIMWEFLGTMNRRGGPERLSWNKALRGVPYLLDDQGVIHPNEPEQLLVMDPRIIRIVESGKQPLVGRLAVIGNGPKSELWKRVALQVVQDLQKTYGGDIRWQEIKTERPYLPGKKMRAPALPSLTFEKDGKQFRVYGMTSRTYGTSMYLDYTFGREKNSTAVINDSKLQEFSVPVIVHTFKKQIEMVCALPSDLRFEPFMSDDAAKAYTDEIAAPGSKFLHEVEIDNGYKAVRVTSDHPFSADGVKLNTRVSMSIRPDNFSVAIYIQLENKPLIYASAPHGEAAFTKTQDASQAMLGLLQKAIKQQYQNFGPDGYGYPKIYNAADWEAFVGWLVLNCGLSFGGALEETYAPQIEKFNSLSEDDRKYLEREFGRVLGERR